ncbi:MAG: hypothetical protein KGL46_14095, partial [Hyphomicrobiales bacterium]|nr:hypothetical protein [Hyphomicrobiales bacterium]
MFAFCALVLLAIMQAAPVFAYETGAWTANATGGTSTAGGVTVTMSGTAISNTAATTLNANGTGSYWTNPYSGTVAGGPSLSFQIYNFGTTSTITISFNRPVNNPVLQFARLGGQPGDGTVDTSVWTLSGSTATSGVSLSRLNGNTQFTLTGSSFQRSIGATASTNPNSGYCLNGDTGATACGSIQVLGTGITSLTFTITWAGNANGTGANSGDAIDLAVSVPDTKVVYAKQSDGGTGSFTFTGTNGVTGSTLNTATTNPASSTASTLTSNSANTTITEGAPPAGYVLTGASCLDQNNATVTSSLALATRVLTIPPNYDVGSTITCTFTNTRATVALQKVSNGGTGTFSYGQTNLASAPAAITTTTAGVVAPAAPTAIAVTTLGTAVTLTETPAAGYVVSAASCTDSNSAVTGNTGAIGSLSGNVLTIPAANVKTGAAFVCTFTNNKTPTLALQKISNGGTGSFSYAQTNLASTPAAITTTTAGTAAPAAPTPINVSAIGTAVTLTETPAAGYVVSAASCTDSNSAVTGNTGAIGSLSGNVLTIPAANVVAGA